MEYKCPGCGGSNFELIDGETDTIKIITLHCFDCEIFTVIDKKKK